MLVKVQQPLDWSSPMGKVILIYDEKEATRGGGFQQLVKCESSLGEELLRVLGQRPKAYFELKDLPAVRIEGFIEVKEQRW